MAEVAASVCAAGACGALAWTLAEYVLHRWVFHGRGRPRLGAAEHRRHHAEPDYFAPVWQKGLAALAVTALLWPAASAFAGIGLGTAFTGGFLFAYLGYEVLHRRCHTHPPRGRYGRWRRRNHFAHHFADPHRAHGVTTSLWDLVFGTGLATQPVRVPRALAMRWLCDGSGAVDPRYAGDYAIVGAAQPAAQA